MSCKPLTACSFFLLPWLWLLWGPLEIWRSRCHSSVSKRTTAFLQRLLSFASFRGSWPELHFYKWHKGCKIRFHANLCGTTGSKCLECAISGCRGQAVVVINWPSLMRHKAAEDVWKELSFSHLKEGLRDGLTHAYVSFCCHLSVSWGLEGIWVMRELRTLRRRPYLLLNLSWPLPYLDLIISLTGSTCIGFLLLEAKWILMNTRSQEFPVSQISQQDFALFCFYLFVCIRS